MPLSTEALLALLSIFVSLPPAILIIWKIISRRQKSNVIASGKNNNELKYLEDPRSSARLL